MKTLLFRNTLSSLGDLNVRRPASGARLCALALAATVILGGCSKTPPATQPQTGQQPAPGQTPNQAATQAMNPEAAPPPAQAAQQPYAPARQQAYAPAPQQRYAPAPRPAAPEVAALTIPAGTHIRITTTQDLGSKISQPGQSFSATVADPVVLRGVTVIRGGASATGTVVDAKALGRFKGGAVLQLRLDSVRAEGRTYEVESSTIDRVEKGKGKRTALFAGGGGGLGALIGGLAGGGKGALIGGLAGGRCWHRGIGVHREQGNRDPGGNAADLPVGAGCHVEPVMVPSFIVSGAGAHGHGRRTKGL